MPSTATRAEAPAVAPKAAARKNSDTGPSADLHHQESKGFYLLTSGDQEVYRPTKETTGTVNPHLSHRSGRHTHPAPGSFELSVTSA